MDGGDLYEPPAPNLHLRMTVTILMHLTSSLFYVRMVTKIWASISNKYGNIFNLQYCRLVLNLLLHMVLFHNIKLKGL